MARGKAANAPTPEPQKPKRPVGRPTSYSEDIADEICNRLANGESLVKICRSEHIPDRSTVLRWQQSIPEFAAKCAHARDGQADFLHDDMAEIEDKVISGKLDPAAARVVLSSKQWRAAKLAPKKYGDKIVQEHTGADGGPIQFDASNLTDDQLASLATVLAALAGAAGGDAGGGQGGDKTPGD